MRKPSAAAIVKAGRLTQYSRRPSDPLSACNLCGERFVDGDQNCPLGLEAYREHDEHDWPIPGNDALLFLGYEHEECQRKMVAHARLYEEDTGEPGAFPKLCGPCDYRDGLRCTHGDLKANGGPGLAVRLLGFADMIITTSEGCFRPMKPAVHCAGRRRSRIGAFYPTEAE